MKKKFLLFGVIFFVTALVAHGQVFEMYNQNFEETGSVYTVNPSSQATVVTELAAAGSHSIKLVQQLNSGDVELILDTIDFTQMTDIAYIALEFDHINNIYTNSGGDLDVAQIWYKRTGQNDGPWVQAQGTTEYNREGEYSSEFESLSTFNRESYSEWKRTAMTNQCWHRDRFDFNSVFANVAAQNRKLIIKFVLKPCTRSGGVGNTAWWIDNIRVKASRDPMVTPLIKMHLYPDAGAFPNSRGARIELDAYTTVSQGLCNDSVYVVYSVGSDNTQYSAPMNYIGSVVNYADDNSWSRYRATIPFHGYDTLMNFRCVVKDNTSNFNEATFPKTEGTTITYWYVRGTEQPGESAPSMVGTSNDNLFPFPGDADGLSQWVFDSAFMADAGYGPGAITDLRFTVGANSQASTRYKFNFRFRNAPTDFTINSANKEFTTEFMHVVLDTTLSLPAMSANQEFTIHLDDTFFYAGKDLVMQTIYDGTTVDPPAVSVKTISAPANKQSIYAFNVRAGYNANPYLSYDGLTVVMQQKRPAIVMTQHANMPLIYDLGVSRVTFPSYDDPIVDQPATLTAMLKNYGVNTINAVGITWTIDDTIWGYHDWTGSLAGGDSVSVNIGTINNLPAGYHYLRTWVEDTLTVTAGNLHVRDHEPYNDTAFTEFITCAGPLSGVRVVGDVDYADYNNIEEFLFSLSRCGIDDSLVVKIAPGVYSPFSLPNVSGLSEQHYIAFESLDPENPATVYADATTGTNQIVDISSVGNIRFRNLTFVRRGGMLTNMIAMGSESHNCRYEGCSFIDSVENPQTTMRIAVMIDNSLANNMHVIGCTFVGGAVGVSVHGQSSTIRSTGNIIKKNLFRNQTNMAVSVENVTDITVDHNEMYDVLTNSSNYVLNLMNCYGTINVTGNRILTTNGASAIGIGDMHGTQSNHAIVANNMIVCDDVPGNHTLFSPVRILKAEWTDVVYNSIKLTAPNRSNIAAVTFGGSLIENCRFVNNIVACMDTRNYALNYTPSGQTTNTVGYNVYYSNSATLNRLSGSSYSNLSMWKMALPADSMSISVNPGFLTGSLVDLRTFNRALKGKGTAIAEVTVDMYDTVRSTTTPCPGAFEFSALSYDFGIEDLISPIDETCEMPDSVELVLIVRNGGTSRYNPDSTVVFNMYYSINGGEVHGFAVPEMIPAEDTATVHTGQMLNLPPDGIHDGIYDIKVWGVCSTDPNQTNDTNSYRVVSHYQIPAPANIDTTTLYKTRGVAVVREGVVMWDVYASDDAPKVPSTIYWYHDQDEDPFFVGDSLMTEELLRQDTHFFVKQQREVPIVRITQVMIKPAGNGTVTGLTTPLPSWMNGSTRLALQLTNLGDDTAYLGGQTLTVVSTNASYNNKVLTFPNTVFIAPGEAIVVQYFNGTNTANTVFAGNSNKITPPITENLGFVYSSNGTVIDAVAINNIITASSSQTVKWSTQNVPSYVWNGTAGVTAPSTGSYGGFVRTAFNGDASDWVLASAELPVTLDYVNPDWIRYTSNVCGGSFATVNITISNKPTSDIELVAMPLPEGCGLGEEPLSVQIHNYGDTAVSALQLNYSLGGDTVSETLTSLVGSHGDTTYTFVQSPNLAFATDSNVTITIWATAAEGDADQDNDTTSVSTISLFTPVAPILPDTIEAMYAEQALVSFAYPDNMMPVWYDYNLNAVDTGYSYLTDVLYTSGNIGVSYIAMTDNQVQIGTGSTKTGKNAYPSPYQSNKKYAKQQFIYTASELAAQGLEAGYITGLAFNFDSLTQPTNGTLDSVVFDKYYISLGHTTSNSFSSTSAWQPVSLVSTIDSLVIRRSDNHSWIWHQFDSLFVWNGTNSIVVQIVHEAYVPNTTGMTTIYSEKNNTTLVTSSDDASVEGFSAAGTRGKNRPNIKFNGKLSGCNGSIATVAVRLLNVPTHEATVYMPDGAEEVNYFNCVNVSPEVLVRNLGEDSIKGFDLHYWIGNDTVGAVTHVNDTILSGEIDTVNLFSIALQPGRYNVRVAIDAEGDTIAANDTTNVVLTVRFCSGQYTIKADSTGDFASFSSAIDTLNIVGTSGSLTFAVYPGTYNEQVYLGAAPGLSGIAFIGQGDTAANVCLVANTSAAKNYAFKADGVSNLTIQGITIEARPLASNVKDANALMINNSTAVSIINSRLKVKGTIFDAKASCLVLGDSVRLLSIINSTFDSGYYSIKTTGEGYMDVFISNNTLNNFCNKGIDMSKVTRMQVLNNYIRSGAAANSRALVGINLLHVDSTLNIYANKIYLIDDYKGGKQGIHLEDVTGSELEWATIVNNMIGIHGNGTSCDGTPKNPSGIYIDNASSYINVLYNSVSVDYGTTNSDGRAFYSAASNSNLQVMDNIFANFSNNSYAYYVAGVNSVLMSDYNGYYSSGNKFAYWGSDKANIGALRNANIMDENSLQDMPYFTAVDDLHLLMTNFCGEAQYNGDVLYDIDGTPRPQFPEPTIGAHELPRFESNMTVVKISQPTVPLNLNNPNNIEGDSILVVATFCNNGFTVANGVSWYAYVEGYENEMVSAIKALDTFHPAQLRTDSVWIPTMLGVIDTHVVRVVLINNNDDDPSDNELTARVYLAPAFDLEAVKVQSGSSGCGQTAATISITVKNVGYKPIPVGLTFDISYKAQGYHPSVADANILNIPTMPTTPVTETAVFETALPKGQQRVFTFNTPANLYPTDTALNIKVRLSGWLHYQYDIINGNDSTTNNTNSSTVIDSYYTPRAPQGHDTTLYYGTWGEVTAEQENSRPIRWYRDSTANPFYTTSGSNAYATSCRWSTTPQYFHDSTYYLQCLSDKNCPSSFSEVHVNVREKFENDMAIEAVLAPLGGHVYSENDTVRIRIANYGTLPQSNIPVTYAVRKGNNTNPFQTVTENVATTINPGQTYVYTFDSLVVFANSNTATTAGGTFQVRAWTDLANDQSRRNDTIRNKQILRPSSNNDTQLDYSFSTKPESTYPARTNSASDSVDIIRFSYNEIDVDLPPLGRSYSNFGVFTGPEIPVLHVTRGMTDSVFMMITNPTNPNAVERGRIAIYVDFNRNGSFNDPGECVIPDTNLWNNRLYRGTITVPQSASYGYLKMRVSACRFNKVPTVNLNGQDGHMLDFLLFVDQQAPAKDLAITQIAEPRDYLVTDAVPRTVSFRMANRGASAINAADIHYTFATDNGGDTVSSVYNWTGNLQPGTSTLVSLPAYAFPLGTTELTIWHELSGDVESSNDTLVYEYHRFHTVTLTLDDNFDGAFQYWYAPTGNNGYNHNYWQLGTPNKTKLNAAHSAPNAWVTDLNAPIKSGLRGNISYLYSPIINISQIKPDTISLYLRRDLANKSNMYIEYRNYEGDWVNMIPDTGACPPTWYNNADKGYFDGSTPVTAGYTRYYFASSLVSGNFQENFQFRLVYRTPQGTNANASYGEGCAVDDFRIARARKPIDVGVVAITQPVQPKYGQTIYPEVVVKNFGTDTVRQVKLGYIHYGTYLAKETTITGFALAPDEVDTFLFYNSPMVVTSDFPEDFCITAFTIYSDDIFKDNDTCVKCYHMTHLDNDIAADRFITPLDNVIAGDSITVTMRVFNFGLNPINQANLSYIVSGRPRVDESIDFVAALGHPLQADEYFNYTFRQRFRASMGIMHVTGIVKTDSNEYIYNDTISKRFNGISSIMDLAAAAIVVDTMSTYSGVKVSIVVDNRGARGANDFEVGFWVGDDTVHARREIYHTVNPLPALSRGYHLFDTILPQSGAPYNDITAFVNIENDNDLSNDTTTDFIAQSVDIEALGILVEENSAADCRVFVQLRNNGNMALVGTGLFLNVSVNGNNLDHELHRRLDPMQVVTVPLDRTVPKNPSRHYTGSMSFDLIGDADPTNNQTSRVKVVNYVEGMPTVNDADQLVLEQNYPNPFSHQTTVPFSLPQAAAVRFFVMDATGHIVNAFTGFYSAGANSITIDMQAYAAGIYYYGIEVDGKRQMRKMIIR